MDSNWIVEQRRREVLSTQWALRAPMWELWHERRSAELWQVVALSLDYDPLYRFQHLSLVGVASTNPPPSPPSATRRQPGDELASFETIELLERLRKNMLFVLRLEVAEAYLGTEARERTKVSFHEFRQLAERFNWDLPEGFKLLAPTVVVPDAVAPTAEVMPVIPRGVPKREMVSRHAAHWTTIETDMKSAAANGLAIAKAGKRGWLEAVALEWARQNERLVSAPVPNTIDAVMAGRFTSRHHKLAG